MDYKNIRDTIKLWKIRHSESSWYCHSGRSLVM